MTVKELHTKLTEILEKTESLKIPKDSFHICFEERGMKIKDCKNGYKDIIDFQLNPISFTEQDEYFLTLVLDD